MARMFVVAGVLLLGVGAAMAQQEIAVKQDNLMRAQAKSMYGVILKSLARALAGTATGWGKLERKGTSVLALAE